MKSKILLFFALLALCGCDPSLNINSGQAFFKYFKYESNDPYFDSTLLTKGKIFNPILQGTYPEPSICRKGNDYYMVVSTYSLFPAIPIFHSTDLVNWEHINYALPTEKECLNTSLRSNEGIYPPTIRYNKEQDMFYISGTFVGGGGHFIISSKDPAKKWSTPEYLYGMVGIHASLFFDDDGKTYLIYQSEPNGSEVYYGHRNIILQDFDLNKNSTIGEKTILLPLDPNNPYSPKWLEAPHLYKHEGYYYLTASDGGSLGDWFASCVYRSKDICGPYEPYENNPILSQRMMPKDRPDPITCVGHTDFLELADGRWYVVFQGLRSLNQKGNYVGKETFLLPVTWTEDGWPTVLEQGVPIPKIIDAPFAGTSYSNNKKYLPHGNVSYYEKFDKDTLANYWGYLRTPIGKTYTQNNDEGITIPLSINNFRNVRHMGFICLRVLHNKFSFETSMDFIPETEQEFAGLAMFLGDKNNIQYGVTLNGKKTTLQLKRTLLEDVLFEDMVAEIDISNDFYGRILLNIDNYNEEYFTFKYKFRENDDWQILTDKFSRDYFDINNPGNHGFMGNIIGIYASQEE
ncbi:MAG: glycoside hydrolase family 43 protein [Bacteroidales bacterium]|nr:glycoside hydrolase family 43 protein [Bacteroidales bacterium]